MTSVADGGESRPTAAPHSRTEPDPRPDDRRPLAGRVAVVTGASRGLGAATAVRLGAAGAHVVLLARTVGGLEATDDQVQAVGGTASLLPIDLADGPRIGQAMAALHTRFGRIDVLVGAAGVLGQVAPIAHSQPRSLAEAMTIGFAANYHLIRNADPLLRVAPAGRAVFVGGAVAAPDQPFFAMHACAKAALAALVASWAGELDQTRVRTWLFDPGPMQGALRRAAFPGLPPDSAPAPEAAAERLVAQVLASLPAP